MNFFKDDPASSSLCEQCGDAAAGGGLCHLCHESAVARELVTPEIITLSEQDISEYAEGYDASLLKVGMKVLVEDELFLTADQVDFEIAKESESLEKYNWTDQFERKLRIERLENGLKLLKAPS